MNIEYPDMCRDVTPDVVRHVDTSGTGEGAVIFGQLNEASAEDRIREQVLYFESLGRDFEWKVYDYDQPPDLKERLGSLGFIIGEAETILVLDLEDAPQILWQPVPHNIQRITDPEKTVDVLSVEQQVWYGDFSSGEDRPSVIFASKGCILPSWPCAPRKPKLVR
jgi:hypothetical protein